MSAPAGDGFERLRLSPHGQLISPQPVPRRGYTCDASTTSRDPFTGHPLGYVCVLRAHHNGPVHRGFALNGSHMEWYDLSWWQQLRRWLGLRP